MKLKNEKKIVLVIEIILCILLLLLLNSCECRPSTDSTTIDPQLEYYKMQSNCNMYR